MARIDQRQPRPAATVRELLGCLLRLPMDAPVVIHYDGRYEAPIEDVRLATKEDRRFAVQQRGEHVVIEVGT